MAVFVPRSLYTFGQQQEVGGGRTAVVQRHRRKISVLLESTLFFELGKEARHKEFFDDNIVDKLLDFQI